MSVNTSINTISQNIPPQIMADEEIFYPSNDPNAMPETDIHFKLIANLVLTLAAFFHNRADANAFGDIMFYYKEGSPKHFVAPDVMVCFGANKSPRRVYKLWEETTPKVIIEIASGSTWRDDLEKKFELYEFLDIDEYYVYDPTYQYLPTPFVAYRLINKQFVDVKIENGRVFSEALGLELIDTGETLRLFNPETNEFLMTMEEMATEIARLKAEKQNDGK